MYLLFDVMQRHKSALGHKLMCERSDFERVQTTLSTLSHEELLEAAESLRLTQTTTNPSIGVLRRSIQTVAARVPGSFAQKNDMRTHIKALFVEFGPAALWLTINPADLRDPLILRLAGEAIPQDKLAATTESVRKIGQTDPTIISKFFHAVCDGVLRGLIKPDGDEPGILGEVQTYYGVVESNGRGMHHLHCLIWLRGNLELVDLRDRVTKDAEYAAEVLEYLESIISESVRKTARPSDLEAVDTDMGNNDDDDDERNPNARIPQPRTEDFATEDEFLHALEEYAAQVGGKQQKHNKSHNATCYKYSKKNDPKCRFMFPRAVVDNAHFDEHGIAHLYRDDPWVNPYNTSIAAATGSNQDISFLATKAKALSLLYYITNYATKDDASTYQMVMNAAMLKEAYERAEKAVNPTNEEKRTLQQAMDKFSMRVLNKMACDREVSGVQIASIILGLPQSYYPPATLHRINLNYVRHRFEGITRGQEDLKAIQNEQVPIDLEKKVHISSFDDYKWRGSRLRKLSYYEYMKEIKKRFKRESTSADIDFDSAHPEHGESTQTIWGDRIPERLVGLIGHISTEQEREDRIPGGHMETVAMRNDLAVILLALFVPWEDLPAIFEPYQTVCSEDCENDCDKSTHTSAQIAGRVWDDLQDSLPEYVQDLARNVSLLRKTKEDADIDRLEHRVAEAAMFNATNPNLHDDNEEKEPDEHVELQNGIEELRQCYYLIKKRWAQEDREAAFGIPALAVRSRPVSWELAGLTPAIIVGSMGIQDNVQPETLETWTRLIQTAKQSKDTGLAMDDVDREGPIEKDASDDVDDEPVVDDDIRDGVGPDQDILDNEFAFGPMEPRLIFADPENTDSVVQRARRLGESPSPSAVTRLVEEEWELNTKQRRAVTMVFHHVLRNTGRAAVERKDQFLLYIGGEGGTGKTRVINAIKDGMRLLGRGKQFVVAAPSGTAAKNIHGSTVHAVMGLGVQGRRSNRKKTTLTDQWSGKTMFIIDEISMVGSKTFDEINQQCKSIKNLEPDSTAVFGGLHVVVVLGDFHQFAPVGDTALWDEQSLKFPEKIKGQQLWHQFTDVIVLDEQMRQLQDKTYHELVQRARTGTISQADVDLLNTRIAINLDAEDEDNICIVRENKLRHMINRLQIERFAEARNQMIYLFPATHTRAKLVKASENPSLDMVLQEQDRSEVKAPGLFLYTPNMPAMVLSNLCTRLGIVNGARGRAVEVVPDPKSKRFDVSETQLV